MKGLFRKMLRPHTDELCQATLMAYKKGSLKIFVYMSILKNLWILQVEQQERATNASSRELQTLANFAASSTEKQTIRETMLCVLQLRRIWSYFYMTRYQLLLHLPQTKRWIVHLECHTEKLYNCTMVRSCTPVDLNSHQNVLKWTSRPAIKNGLYITSTTL